MAQKRMFDRSVIETDNFLNISLSAKALYFLLGMEADDEGFVSPNRVLRLYGGEKGDIKNLVDVGLVIIFQSGVVVITDWNQNNWLDTRRIKPTQYQKEKQLLLLTPTKKYELSTGLASARLEERSIEEKRTEENSNGAIAPKQFSFKEEIAKLYDNSRRDLNIIALYFEERKPDIQSYDQFQVALKRHLRDAKDLVPFSDDQILDAIPKAKQSTKEWTISTLVKVLTK